jgi:threonine synthase
MGWIEDKLPRLVAVQSSACAPIPKAWQEKKMESEYWQNPETKIPGLRVPKALGDFLVLKSIYETGGCGVAVPDADAYAAQQRIAATEGCFICPEGAATLAAAEKLTREGWIRPGETVVLLNTATGLKYPETVTFKASVLEKTDDIV